MEQIALFTAYTVFFAWTVGFLISLFAALLNLCGLNIRFSIKPVYRMWHSAVSGMKRVYSQRSVEHKSSIQHTTI